MSKDVPVTTNSIGLLSFMSIALLFSADYEGGVDMLDACIEYVRAATAALEAKQ